MENNTLMHSVQIYWNSIAYAMEEVVATIPNIGRNGEFNDSAKNTIETAHNCSYLYGLSILDKNYLINYTNNVMLFYHQLTPLIENLDFIVRLQNIVHSQLIGGTRFFDQFLYTIGVCE